jgi:hypothetical protein
MLKKLLLKIIYQLFSISIFLTIFAYAILKAYGFQVDFQTMEVIPTSVLDISTTADEFPGKINVWLDEIEVAQSTPINIRNLALGEYQLTIKKEGFLPWKKEVKLNNNLIVQKKNILLIPENFSASQNLVFKGVVDFVFSPDREKIAVINEDQRILSIVSLADRQIFHFYEQNSIDQLFWEGNTQVVFTSSNGDAGKYDLEHKLKINKAVIIQSPALKKENIFIKDQYEIWQKLPERIRGRLSVPIEKITEINARQNILFSSSRYITLCDIDLQNCQQLAEKDPESSWVFDEKNLNLYFIFDQNLFQISVKHS